MPETGTPRPAEPTQKDIGFFLTPDFSPLGFVSALEVLRTANRFLGETFYGWRILSSDGLPVTSANGVTMVADASPADTSGLDILFVCTGFHPEAHCSERTLAWLRNMHRHGVHLGAISTGTFVLAKAGVIGERRCTIHGDNTAALREMFDEIDLVDGVFEIDRNLYTCAGGTSAIDMFIHIVSTDHGERFAADIAHQFQQDRVRAATEHQSKPKRSGLRLKSSKLANALDLMEENIESPLASDELAERVGVSPRQLQRLFKKHTGRAPKDFYLNLRLNHGRLLLLQTSLPVLEVAIASGFSSHAHFTKCYSDRFGYPPRWERRQIL